MKTPNFNIIVDTREQEPFQFSCADEFVEDIKTSGLKTGDYTIEGLEDVLCIERKKDSKELANNVVQKRFKNELARMEKYKYKFIVIEQSRHEIERYPFNLSLSKATKARIKVRGAFILSSLLSYALDYDVHVVFCKDKREAEKVAYDIMKKVARRELA